MTKKTNKVLHVVTGAFGYSGRRIAKKLLQEGKRVRTLTNSPGKRTGEDNGVEIFPLSFSRPAELAKALEGASVLYNTYWVRFNHRKFTHDDAVRNTKILFEAAKKAGVGRIVHTSITNPSKTSGLEYFSGKAELEEALIDSGVPYSILRPAVLFGGEDILINNIAWLLRKLPVFGVFGRGKYRLQPIHVDDFAELAVEHGKLTGNHLVNAIGPETFSYRELVEAIGKIIGISRPIFSAPKTLGWLVGQIVGKAMNDVTITWPEIKGLMEERLYAPAPPAGKTRLTDWARQNKKTLGMKYASELKRRDS